MTNRITIFLVLLICIPSLLSAQDSDSISVHSRCLNDDLHSVLDGVAHIYSSPVRWHSDDWLIAGGMISAVAGTFLIDEGIRRTMLSNQGDFGEKLNAVGNFYGQARYAVAFSIGMYGFGVIADDPWIRGTGITLVQTLASAGALNLALKVLVGRSRPYTNSGNTDFRPLAWKEESFSLPSGHAVVAFSMSSVLASRIKNTWATVGLYALASITAWSRLYSDDHWLSDVVLGSAFSTAMGISAVNWYETDQAQQLGLRVVPMPNGVFACFTF